ncbi:MAG: Mov34/MPN/PAD-1 family protein [Planctomycetota bacterium]
MTVTEPHGVYVLSRVVGELLAVCERAMPAEALGVLVGWRCQHEGRRYVRVVDWATGETDAGPAHAKLTQRGVATYHVELDEKYGAERRGPHVVGVFHSHPFGGEPRLSERDLATFASFPYAAAGNVFVLVNPRTGHVLVYQRDAAGELVEQEWVEYAPRALGGD